MLTDSRNLENDWVFSGAGAGPAVFMEKGNAILT
jgi:hypothetical protein